MDADNLIKALLRFLFSLQAEGFAVEFTHSGYEDFVSKILFIANCVSVVKVQKRH